jgi:radical SAM family protein/glutamine amidotransferase-like protein
VELLRHRGPEGSGFVATKHFVAAHALLAFHDRESAHQPFCSSDGYHTVLFNGEIYNYEQLKRDLAYLGARFVIMMPALTLVRSGPFRGGLASSLIWGSGVSEMEYLVKEHGVREIMFYDDVFTMKRKRVYEICDLIRARRIRVRWEAPTRVDLVDADLLKAMATAGCIRLRFGIESGDPDILERMKKRADLAAIESAVRAAKRAGKQTFAYFIVGWLDESEEQFQRTLDLAKRLPLDYASFYTATPLPGTTLHKEAVAAGRIPADYWLQYIRGETQKRVGLMALDAEARSRRAYREFYLRFPKVPTLIRHMPEPQAFMPILTGLASLLRSDANAIRDM